MFHIRGRSKKAGFTMLELLVVVAIIGILVAILLPVLGVARRRSRQQAATTALQAISMALEKYRDDFRYYPPHDKAMGTLGIPAAQPQGGSEVLAYYLCRKHTWGDMHYGPYLENVGEGRLVDPGSGQPKRLLSPLGGYYQYMLLEDDDAGTVGDRARRRCLVVDSGGDGKWGGNIDMTAGWVSDNSDSNGDGELDDKDNIFSNTPTK
jgi:type II secretion system protein G